MYEIIKNVILSGTYELTSMLKKIDTVWIQGDISDEQRKELIEMTQANANPENSHAPLQEQINALFANDREMSEILNDVIKRINVLEGVEVLPDEPVVEEYPEWYRWDGVGDNPWQLESKCTHNGVNYISMVGNNIWEPGAVGVYDNIWKPEE